MSAIALLVKNKNIYLYSDGKAVDAPGGGNIISENLNKIHLVNDKLAYQIIGRWQPDYPLQIKQRIKNKQAVNPKSAADVLSDFIRQDHLSDNRFIVTVIGIKDSQPEGYLIDTNSKNNYKPVEMPMPTGDKELIFSYAFGKDWGFEQKQFPDLVNEYKANMSFGKATKKAFTEMVRIREEAGVPVGGTIYQRKIYPVKMKAY